jgi:5-methylcytosine-specific restriction endonuclease McrBC GTP-binding regulatory subunit McrB
VRRRFHFTDEEIIDLHISLKTGGLVILSGTSGTGKSRLAELYAESLGMTSDNGRFLWIPVRPRWTDDDDLLGFYNTRSHRYEPGETGLVELLSRALREPESLYVCLFDEMNLARVEHYFSQFLSLLERNPEDRRLTLYSCTFSSESENAEAFPPQLPIGSNVLFMGTINVDESTHHLSDKVLDRANFLRFEEVNLTGWWAQRTREADPVPPREVTFRDWTQFINRAPSLTPEELGLLERINALLHQTGMQFGYRVVEQIDAYLANIPVGPNGEPMLDRYKALDLQIAHRILPKLRGTYEELRPILGSMGEGKSALERELLDSGLINPGSSASLALIENKKRALELHDHTL